MEDLKRSLKMPLFGNTFSPKKVPPRKSASLSNLHTMDRSIRDIELGLEYGSPSMKLGGQSWKFDDGQWILEAGGNTSGKELQRVKKRNVQLEEENNLLKLKIDLLLDMLTERTVECHLMGKDGEDIKIQNRRQK
ncbi:protein chibby homolog 1 isoform X2 [Gouania willdenowi]|uniref:Uncharacterized protein n=1 Tax=Gouania willdenowi TaxID=441366 RepID=A0A8C5N6M0_GOUWI|nr:protein chibby homolog 1 isoform X2 [Gouania willdenowi]